LAFSLASARSKGLPGLVVLISVIRAATAPA
jgi:hypothetical protein